MREDPGGHWIQDPEVGGAASSGGVPFIDLLRFLAGAPIVSVQVAALAPKGKACARTR
jgi:predicted dehydrogenase